MNPRNRSLLVGRAMISAIAVVFMIFSVIVAATPLRGEEEYVGMTFRELQTANPRLANTTWHYTAGIGTLIFGVNLLIAILSWKGLSRDPGLAWLSILILTLTFLLGLLIAHVPIGNTSFSHVGIPSILTLLYLVGLAVSAKPALSKRAKTA